MRAIDLKLGFSGRTVLSDVNVDLKRGSITALSGWLNPIASMLLTTKISRLNLATLCINRRSRWSGGCGGCGDRAPP